MPTSKGHFVIIVSFAPQFLFDEIQYIIQSLNLSGETAFGPDMREGGN